MPDEDPQFDNWKDAWEYEAGQARDFCMSLTEDDLLTIIKDGRSDQFFQIWAAIGQKGTKEKSPPVLIDYLEKNPEDVMDLTRYHCLEALFNILKIKNQEQIDDFQNKVSQLSQKKNKGKFKEGLEELNKLILIKK